MIRFLQMVGLAVLLPAATVAQPVRVTSGEHDGFTRLVLDYGTALDWQVGRTPDGYEVRLSDAAPVYDLTGIYDLIDRRRLAAVWVDPQSGALRLGIGCACHAQPFEFRPGIVVIDLRPGPPPTGSAFELALDGGPLPALAPRPAPRPRARPARAPSAPAFPVRPAAYDWTATLLTPAPQADPAPGLPGADPALQPLREVLLHQLGRGAAQGVVDLALPDPPFAVPPPAESLRIRVGGMPGLRLDTDAPAPTGLTAAGAACLPDERLDLAGWGTDQPVSEQIAGATSGLLGEFDIPDPDAVLRAARFLLFIGFGAEARQLLAQMPTPQPDAQIFISLAHVLDASHDPQPAFAGMAACDTAAALWAMLGDPVPSRGEAFHRAAALRSFSGLPIHLRRLLAPRLADRFLALDDAAAARAVRDAVLRAPGGAGPGTALMEARIDLDGGDPALADLRLEPLIAASGPATPEALLAQVETHLARRAPMTPAQITALEALLHERREGPEAARSAQALTLARALSGDFGQAFAELPKVPEAAQTVWSLLAEIGPDSAVLTHAVLPDGRTPPVPVPVAATLARRLSELGFPAQAAAWLRQVPDPNTDLSVRILLQAGDARTALRLLSGDDDPALLPLRSDALARLDDDAALADILAQAGEDGARWRAVNRARDWAQIADSGPLPLQPLAATAIGAAAELPAFPTPDGPLAQGHALLDASARTRQQIADLLAATAGPVPTGP